tara:strand:- start:298 stop:552 length:255 start_codon:yes stop_codon:yes gene_type:complete
MTSNEDQRGLANAPEKPKGQKLDAPALTKLLKDSCGRKDCVVISDREISTSEKERLIKLIGQDLVDELSEIADRVHNRAQNARE